MTADRVPDGKEAGRPALGRPRDGKIDAAVIAATRELIVETGYSALTLSAIAARAGTTTAAIYRRWSGKAHLVHEAVLTDEIIAVPSGSGDVREDIRAMVETVRRVFDKPEVRVALPGLIADTVADPELHSMMIARLSGNLTAFESRFGQERRGGDDLPLLAEVVVGAAIFRIVIRRDAALDDAWVDDMTTMLVEQWGA
ncbi:TetR family transcriptional regulator [Mycolicibacterium sp. 018/SC-01/001]|uniref:TetR-like C-terminal domain-containing protein n=1 Tax=Mycolicibacterium sp. 018/SC-01/001 TaxID=2592069 RepID=UPI00117CDD97|nr:TetR-like C-terminal domain-containing protein [Mycolicibacterium sp. 018/SC-01/001]TRW79658.1 TetR family transcriptional regulator [Mycolicibacterium sp. 018/SC-01/001]